MFFYPKDIFTRKNIMQWIAKKGDLYGNQYSI